MTHSLLSLHLSHRTKQLTDHISHALNQESHLPNSAKRYAQLLISLGEEDLARSTYLQSRTDYVRRKIRAMQHPGAYGTNDVDGVVEAIAWVMVRIIKNSWTVYSDTFSEARMASSFVDWANGQADGTHVPPALTSPTPVSPVLRVLMQGDRVLRDFQETVVRIFFGITGLYA